ncbi:hypothetical protein HMPREF9193_00238 [Treponema lecithinolyticum ATCC 700332]|uniref:Uncharacterized protein n=1 Tax=Treponema lecithinolyticum ATCC 700332 TaxID=1321815 RepID=A0ABN0P192_TRELE|nr:hypothetical protein HMPREF9193_00238 [Treponema lecithinolyticum ATCC 700332]
MDGRIFALIPAVTVRIERYTMKGGCLCVDTVRVGTLDSLGAVCLNKL